MKNIFAIVCLLFLSSCQTCPTVQGERNRFCGECRSLTYSPDCFSHNNSHRYVCISEGFWVKAPVEIKAERDE